MAGGPAAEVENTASPPVADKHARHHARQQPVAWIERCAPRCVITTTLNHQAADVMTLPVCLRRRKSAIENLRSSGRKKDRQASDQRDHKRAVWCVFGGGVLFQKASIFRKRSWQRRGRYKLYVLVAGHAPAKTACTCSSLRKAPTAYFTDGQQASRVLVQMLVRNGPVCNLLSSARQCSCYEEACTACVICTLAMPTWVLAQKHLVQIRHVLFLAAICGVVQKHG